MRSNYNAQIRLTYIFLAHLSVAFACYVRVRSLYLSSLQPLLFRSHRIIAMNCFYVCRRFSAVAIIFALALGATGNLNVFAQARRQPPTGNEKKNKRPSDTTPGEK